MTDGGTRIRQAAAKAVVDKLMQGADFEDVARAGEAAADDEYLRLVGEHRRSTRAAWVWTGTVMVVIVAAAAILLVAMA